jgi:hypothetical protein
MSIRDIDLNNVYGELVALEEEIHSLKQRQAQLNEGVKNAFKDDFEQKLYSKPEPFGKVTVFVDKFQLQYDVPKTVKWDQEKLAEIYKTISEHEDPANYIKTVYEVSEAAFKTWPADVQDVFKEARTTKPGNPRITIVSLDHEESGQ